MDKQFMPSSEDEPVTPTTMSGSCNVNRISDVSGPTQDGEMIISNHLVADTGIMTPLPQIAPASPPFSNITPGSQQQTSFVQPEYMDYQDCQRHEYEVIRQSRQNAHHEAQMAEHEQKLARDLSMDTSVHLESGVHQQPATGHGMQVPRRYYPIAMRPNRYSTSNLTMATGGNNSGFSTTQYPGTWDSRGWLAGDEHDPARLSSTTHYESDNDDKEEAVRQDPTSHRSTKATRLQQRPLTIEVRLHRYSMPVTRSRPIVVGTGLDQTNTTRFLFGQDEYDGAGGFNAGMPTIDHFPAMGDFPTLKRRDDQPNILSASTAAKDLAYSQPGTTGDASSPNVWADGQSNQGSVSHVTVGGNGGNILASGPNSLRNSLTLDTYSSQASSAGDLGPTSPSSGNHRELFPLLASGLSQHQGANGARNGVTPISNTNVNSNHRFINQNWSKHNGDNSFTPSNRRSFEFASPHGNARLQSVSAGQTDGYGNVAISSPSYASLLPGTHVLHQQQQHQQHSSLAPQMHLHVASSPTDHYVGPDSTLAASFLPGVTGSGALSLDSRLVGAMQGLNFHSNLLRHVGSQQYSNNHITPNFTSSVPVTTREDRNQARAFSNDSRRQDTQVPGHWTCMSVDHMPGEVLSMCRDQTGCRHLQRQLESRNPELIHLIWSETHQHVVELMVNPFGNYLCQKLLEYCNQHERTALVKAASTNLVKIALNQHGTRALQKMIELLSTREQTDMIINSLRHHVVQLIQDLNGNHVIQKCLNKLSSHDADFIFQAVGDNCVEVGTHRHGCCVLQRCIDHAVGPQKQSLISNITKHALILVQDPFGNYVIQYIIDLNEPGFTEPLVQMFNGQVVGLSRHKFSSNVIEKCLRCATDISKDLIVAEMLEGAKIDQMLRDSFANYVVQTALEHATPRMKLALIEAIRPLLPSVRNTPYARRISAKIQAHDAGTRPITDRHTSQLSTRSSMHHHLNMVPANCHANLETFGGSIHAPATSVMTNSSQPAHGYLFQGRSQLHPALHPQGAPMHGSLSAMAGPPYFITSWTQTPRSSIHGPIGSTINAGPFSSNNIPHGPNGALGSHGHNGALGPHSPNGTLGPHGPNSSMGQGPTSSYPANYQHQPQGQDGSPPPGFI